LCGPRPSYGYCPLPPLSNSAPEKNIYRLTEFDYGNDIQITVISACGISQVPKLDQTGKYAKYINIPFPDWFYSFSQKKFFHLRIFESFMISFFGTQDMFSAIYLTKVCKEVTAISPDLLLINSFPQYIRFIRSKFPKVKIGLFVRGEMGSSRKYLPLTDLIITNSEGISKYIKELLNGIDIPIEKIPNSLEDSFCTIKKDYSTFHNKFIYTGRIETTKGIRELLMAFALVQKCIPDAKLEIVGGNFNSRKLNNFEQSLLDYTNLHQLNVSFLGELPNQQLPRHLLKADVAVFPSKCLESFGMVALEAMRCGLPVVASRRPGFEELIVNGQTGILIDNPEEIEVLAKTMVNLLRQPSEIERMGKNGYVRSLQFLPSSIKDSFRKIIFSR